MQKKFLAAAIIGLCVLFISCNKKQQPQTAVIDSPNNTVGKGEKKILVRKKPVCGIVAKQSTNFIK